MGLIGSIVIGFFALLGTPLFIVILAAAMLGFYLADIPLMVIAIEIYRLIDTPLLLALPLFTFAGYLLAESQLSSRLVRLTQVFLGWMPGGLAVVSFVPCAFFTAFTGASGVTIVAVGALLNACDHHELPEDFIDFVPPFMLTTAARDWSEHLKAFISEHVHPSKTVSQGG